MIPFCDARHPKPKAGVIAVARMVSWWSSSEAFRMVPRAIKRLRRLLFLKIHHLNDRSWTQLKMLHNCVCVMMFQKTLWWHCKIFVRWNMLTFLAFDELPWWIGRFAPNASGVQRMTDVGPWTKLGRDSKSTTSVCLKISFPDIHIVSYIKIAHWQTKSVFVRMLGVTCLKDCWKSLRPWIWGTYGYLAPRQDCCGSDLRPAPPGWEVGILWAPTRIRQNVRASDFKKNLKLNNVK